MLSWRKIVSAAVSPLIRFRLSVTTKPACENKRSEAAEGTTEATRTPKAQLRCGPAAVVCVLCAAGLATGGLGWVAIIVGSKRRSKPLPA